MDRKKLLDQMMAEEGEKPVEMVAPKKRSLFDMVLGKDVEQAPEAPSYPEPYEVDRKLRAEGFQIQPEKRLFFERIARMLKK